MRSGEETGVDNDAPHEPAARKTLKGNPCVVWSSWYFTCSDFPKRQGVTIRAILRWCVDGHMGALVAADPTTHKSKIAIPAHVDDAQGKLLRAHAVLL